MFPCTPLHRVFYALRPPPSAAVWLAQDTAWLGRSRRVRADMLHITLNILDDWEVQPKELLNAMLRIGDGIAAPTFRVVFDQLSGGAQSVVLRPSERITTLYAFQSLLAERLARAGIPARTGFRFSPHVSLVHRGWPGLDRYADPLSWRVEEFVLIESLVGRTEHHVHGRWRLN